MIVRFKTQGAPHEIKISGFSAHIRGNEDKSVSMTLISPFEEIHWDRCTGLTIIDKSDIKPSGMSDRNECLAKQIKDT